jgi:hypothetical protein
MYSKYRRKVPGTETILYNCHSFAFHSSLGDPTDQRNEYPISQGRTRWDNNPDDDLLESYQALDIDADSQIGDRVIYFDDTNQDGLWTEGEKILHSAVVNNVDEEGNVLTIAQKMGEGPLAEAAPNYSGYEVVIDSSEFGQYREITTTRAYFRKTDTVEVENVEE